MAKKLVYKTFSYLIILIIFFFLGRTLFENWQKIKDYDFSFNYFYLILSIFFLSGALILDSAIWNKILRILIPEKKISYFTAFRIAIYSRFGRYIPGKVWMFTGRVYLGRKEGLSKKVLTVSVIYEIILSISSGFLLSLFLLSIALGSKLGDLYSVTVLIIPILIFGFSFIFIHPKIICPVFNFGLRKFNKIEINPDNFLSYARIIQVTLYHFIVFFIEGLAFFFLINSIISVPLYAMIGVAGAYILAAMSGAVVFFAPAGLGIREGILVLILQFYLPLSIAVLISLIARIWASLVEIILITGVYLYSKIKKLAIKKRL